MSIHYSLVNGILVFLKLTPSTHFSPLFNCKAQIVICHVLFDTLRIRWYTKDFLIESYHACLNIMKPGKFFKIPGQGVATLLCGLCIPSVKIFSHMKLTPSLCFLQLFNFCQLSFTMWFYNTLRICWYTKKNWMKSFHTCLNIVEVGMFFQNWWTKGNHVSMLMVIVKQLLMFQKITIQYSQICEYYIPYITIGFPHMTNGWLHIKNWHIVYVFHHFSTITNIVICQVFFNTLNICSHINDFLIH
jgi:hypothetical protein